MTRALPAGWSVVSGQGQRAPLRSQAIADLYRLRERTSEMIAERTEPRLPVRGFTYDWEAYVACRDHMRAVRDAFIALGVTDVAAQCDPPLLTDGDGWPLWGQGQVATLLAVRRDISGYLEGW